VSSLVDSFTNLEKLESLVSCWLASLLLGSPLVTFSLSSFNYNYNTSLLTPEEIDYSLSFKSIIRQKEFLLGRIVLKSALANQKLHIDLKNFSILQDSAGFPILPQGVKAQLSHKGGIAIAVATIQKASLGVDLEFPYSGSLKLKSTFFLDKFAAKLAEPEEIKMVSETLVKDSKLAINSLLTVIFSIKESIYKANYDRDGSLKKYKLESITELEPLVGDFLGFRSFSGQFSGGLRASSRFYALIGLEGSNDICLSLCI
jgi:4'-phosphopantetheinyl transferase EntD